ncbi:tRNA (5-methylaminomethyl-2-thiouridine)(34)-methyltransferase MnmD [Seonamhaeicola maritimus]|uniref:tRNA (5-methylaminomethyl-2-thiouridine)(34)-methyltransferase MnmD n=1 Tax=Seonamhaeicola maritimus TaxID=2591822 RepID=A0A5C7GE52_9FLAO|nr:tRNA (5-methylaminomethyl-2-thiouridine)(34)-methyltransferase MnmD [Seonamhaeicola maritimus]TXG35211.1 tRNA (5-methylaminomethyl-2-thiouridine)(34)-methyltransferase MnmD [Seonamhaeicola maritimus]
MKREIITTADGSKTIHIPEWNEQYHSKHGAIQEAYHVFIKHGLHYYGQSNTETVHIEEPLNSLSILEIGFGTGLNALITLLESEKLKTKVDYVGVEAYPISQEEVSGLNYASELNSDRLIFDKLHEVSWEEKHQISDQFSLKKQKKFFDEIKEKEVYNIIYFDAFGARVQPELWTEYIFKKMYDALKENGVLVTYSAKGSVRRAMQSVGFTVEKLPGPPGKREMLRAAKWRSD